MQLTNSAILAFLIKFIIFCISAFPLYFAVSIFRKKVSFLSVLLVTLISGFLITALNSYFKVWGFLISFLILILVYREVFRLKWFNAFIVWVLQFLFIVLFIGLSALIAALLGFSGIGFL